MVGKTSPKLFPHYNDDLEPASRAYAIARDVAHIHVFPEGLNTASLAKFVDFLITVYGKAGLEFAGCEMLNNLGRCGFLWAMALSRNRRLRMPAQGRSPEGRK